MKNRPILLIPGDLNSIFFEIFFKSLKKKKYKSPIVIITSSKIISKEVKKYRFKKKIRFLDIKKIKNYKLNNNTLNILDVDLKINQKSNSFNSKLLNESFKIAFKILKSGFTNKFINGPINKKKFLKRNIPGITEYISKKFNEKKIAMLIFNEKLSVCPITTHLPLKLVAKNITKQKIMEKVFLIENFYKKNIGLKPKIAVVGLNPHCETSGVYNEDDQIIKPSIKHLQKKNYRIQGPFPADTIFLKKNREKFNVILGMYHDQVLTPIKTLFEYDAINITLGLPFFRVSPDHGPNEKMVGKNLSSPISLMKSLNFLDNK